VNRWFEYGKDRTFAIVDPFEVKMRRLTAEQFEQSATLEATIRESLKGVGYGV
jgi:hypothetical protein